MTYQAEVRLDHYLLPPTPGLPDGTPATNPILHVTDGSIAELPEYPIPPFQGFTY